MKLSTRIVEKYTERLNSIPVPGGGGAHTYIQGVCNIGVFAGLTDAHLLMDIRRSIPRGTRHVPDSEILDAIATARRDCKPGSKAIGYQPRPQPVVRFDPAKYMRNLLARSDGAGDADIWESSPYRLDWETGPEDSLVLLESLYDPQDILFIGGQYDKRVVTVTTWVDQIHKAGAIPWPHIIPNPVDGMEHPKKDGGMSFRGDAAVSKFKYAVVEFDQTPEYLLTTEQQAAKATWEATNTGGWPDWPAWPMTDQLAFWHSMIRVVPVVILCTSGGKSIHGWIRMDCADRAAWDRDTGKLFDEWMVPLGADGSCRNCGRLSRLAGHYRAEKNGWQRLLYLNPANVIREAKETAANLRLRPVVTT